MPSKQWSSSYQSSQHPWLSGCVANRAIFNSLLLFNVCPYAFYRPHACLCPKYFMYEIFKVENMVHSNLSFISLFFSWPNPSFSWKILRKKKVLVASSKKVLLILPFVFLIFPWFNLSFLQKILRKRRVLIVGGKKILPILSFLSLFSLGPIHLFLEK